MKKFSSILILSVLCFFITPIPATMAAWEENQILDEAFSDLFGSAVAVDGDTMVVGSPGDNSSTGSAYVYTESGGTWTLEQELPPPTQPTIGFDVDLNVSFYGSVVDIYGDHIVIGAPGDRLGGVANTGSVHFFERSGTTWTSTGSFENPEIDEHDRLGHSVSINNTSDGIQAIVGRRGEGEVRFYAYSGGSWTFSHGITIGGQLGEAVDMEGDYAIACAPYANVPIYHNSGGTWAWVQTLSVAGQCKDVELDGDYALIGDYLYDTSDPYVGNAGAVRVYKTSDGGSTWDNPPPGLEFYIENPTPVSNDYFGWGVEMDGANIIIGEWEYGTAEGRAHIYTGADSSWTSTIVLEASNTGNSIYFSLDAVEIEGDLAIVGAENISGEGGRTGAVYVFGTLPSGGGAVPEFSDYVLMLTVVIALGFMIKLVPKMGSGMRAA